MDVAAGLDSVPLDADDALEERASEGLQFDQLPPELLNEKNRQLTREIQDLQRSINDSQKQIRAQAERKKVLDDHFQQVKLEVQNSQSLLEARKSEVETEEHMKQIVLRELGRYRGDISKYQDTLATQQDRLNSIQNALFRANEKMDQFKLEMNWNQEELEQWALAQRQKEDDEVAIKKYGKEDERKMKELNMKIEKLASEVLSRKQELEAEVTETQAAQIQLDKTAEDFRKLHEERNDLVRQWEEAIAAMKKRDDLILEMGEQFADGQRKIDEEKERIAEKENLLKIEEQNNKELEVRISGSERSISQLRDEQTSVEESLKNLEDEVEVLKNTLSKASSDLNNLKNENDGLMNKQRDLMIKMDKTRSNLDLQKEKVQLEKKAASDRESQAIDVEQLLKETQQQSVLMEAKLNQVKDDQYKKQENLNRLRRDEADLISEINGIQSQHKNMRSKIKQLDQDSFKQQELLYNLEFKIQLMERKVSRAMGERTEEEKKELKAKIEVLQKELNDVQAQHKMLQQQVKNVTQNRRQSERKSSELTRQRDQLRELIVSLNLEITSCEDEQRVLLTKKQEFMVQSDLLQLQLKRLRQIFSSRADDVFSLENRKFQIETTMVEKEKEIAAHREVLLGEWRKYEDERHKMQMELTERRQAVDRLKKRYEILLSRMRSQAGSEEGEVGEMTQAQYIIRAAQKREELQRYGDELDSKIQKLEKEEEALIRALNLLNVRNSDFRTGFKKVQYGTDVEKRAELVDKDREITQSLNYVKRELNDVKNINNQMLMELTVRDDEKLDIEQSIEEVRNKEQLLLEEIAAHEKKIQTLQKHLQKLRTSLREKKSIQDRHKRESGEELDDDDFDDDDEAEAAARLGRGAPVDPLTTYRSWTTEEKDLYIFQRREVMKDALRQISDLIQSVSTDVAGSVSSASSTAAEAANSTMVLSPEDAERLKAYFDSLLVKYDLQLPRPVGGTAAGIGGGGGSSRGSSRASSTRPSSAASNASVSSVRSSSSAVSASGSGIGGGSSSRYSVGGGIPRSGGRSVDQSQTSPGSSSSRASSASSTGSRNGRRSIELRL